MEFFFVILLEVLEPNLIKIGVKSHLPTFTDSKLFTGYRNFFTKFRVTP